MHYESKEVEPSSIYLPILQQLHQRQLPLQVLFQLYQFIPFKYDTGLNIIKVLNIYKKKSTEYRTSVVAQICQGYYKFQNSFLIVTRWFSSCSLISSTNFKGTFSVGNKLNSPVDKCHLNVLLL